MGFGVDFDRNVACYPWRSMGCRLAARPSPNAYKRGLLEKTTAVRVYSRGYDSFVWVRVGSKIILVEDNSVRPPALVKSSRKRTRTCTIYMMSGFSCRSGIEL